MILDIDWTHRVPFVEQLAQLLAVDFWGWEHMLGTTHITQKPSFLRALGSHVAWSNHLIDNENYERPQAWPKNISVPFCPAG